MIILSFFVFSSFFNLAVNSFSKEELVKVCLVFHYIIATSNISSHMTATSNMIIFIVQESQFWRALPRRTCFHIGSSLNLIITLSTNLIAICEKLFISVEGPRTVSYLICPNFDSLWLV